MQLTVTKVRVAAPILHYVFRAVQQLSELSASRPRAPMSHNRSGCLFILIPD